MNSSRKMSDINAVIVVLMSMCFVVLSSPILSKMKKYSCDEVQLSCEKPQSRVFFASDLTEDEELKNLLQINEVYPSSVVLHRCESSGCCQNPEHKCLPKWSKTERVKLAFSYNSPDLKECEVTIEEFDHTECECRYSSKEDKRKRIFRKSCT